MSRNKREFRFLSEKWLCTAWLPAGSGAGGGRGEGEGSCPGRVPSPRSERGTSIFVALCTFRSGGDLRGTRFVYWSTFPVSPSGNLRAGSPPFPASTRRPGPHLPSSSAGRGLRLGFSIPWSPPGPLRLGFSIPWSPPGLLPARWFPLPPSSWQGLLAEATGRAGEMGSAGNVVCLLRPQLFAANK